MNAPPALGVLVSLDSSASTFGDGSESKDQLPRLLDVPYNARVSYEDGARNVSKQPTQFRLMCSSVVRWHHGGINE